MGTEPLCAGAGRIDMARRTMHGLVAGSLVAALLASLVVASASGRGAGGRRPAPSSSATRSAVHGVDVRATRGFSVPRTAAAEHTHTLEADPAAWSRALDAVIGGRPVSVSVAVRGRLRFSHLGDVPRAPASNEKLLLSMALLDRFGPRARIPTTVELRCDPRHGVVRGDVWLVGHGDPELDDADVARLAALVADDGITRITGSVVGDTSTFDRDRWAPGWHRIALSYVSIPTALTFDANADAAGFVFHPERAAASALTTDLERLGVSVIGEAEAGVAAATAEPVARIRSDPLVQILRRQNTASINLNAEVLGKRLGAVVTRRRGSIASGARALATWAAGHGVHVTAHDASGLSYANRVTTDGLVGLLVAAEQAPWGAALRSTLPSAGTGTLDGRLDGIDVRAKTGTLLNGVSALSGWVRTRRGRWASFSILSAGMAKEDAVRIEDAIVRFLAERA